MSNEPIPDNDELDPNSSIAYIALSILCSRQKSLIPELLYILSPQQITNFIKVFSGETLKIPTVDEFRRDLMASLAVYHIVVEGKSWDWFQLKYSLDGNYINSIKSRLGKWINGLDSSEKSFIERLPAIEVARKESRRSIYSLVREDDRVR
jgi:hypothetical protein